MIRLLFMSVLILFLNSCSLKQVSLNETQKHTVKSGELKLLMHDMNMVIYDKGKSVLEQDNTRRRYALTLANNIKKISSQIKELPIEKFTQNIDKKERILFTKYIKELHQKGEDIYQLAQNYELEKLDNELQDLQGICKGCHSKFRDH